MNNSIKVNLARRSRDYRIDKITGAILVTLSDGTVFRVGDWMAEAQAGELAQRNTTFTVSVIDEERL